MNNKAKSEHELLVTIADSLELILKELRKKPKPPKKNENTKTVRQSTKNK